MGCGLKFDPSLSCAGGWYFLVGLGFFLVTIVPTTHRIECLCCLGLAGIASKSVKTESSLPT